MNDRLEPLILLPPRAGTPWCGAACDSDRLVISREGGTPVTVDLPLFWYDPMWCDVTTSTADILATAVGQAGVLVSALRSDLAGPENQSRFHGLEPQVVDGKEPEPSDPGGSLMLSRIVPYRPERYGLNARDFDDARIIDVRLTINRDATGRFAFSPSQIERWEAASANEPTPGNEPVAGGGWVPAAAFPPDVASIDDLGVKLYQLRALAPDAAVFASIGPYRMKAELPRILNARPDGLILRLDEVSLDGLQLAALTRRARKMMDDADATSVPLWVVPGPITPDDAVKLIALGATAIAVDSWCDPLITESAQKQQATFARLGYHTTSAGDEDYLHQLARYQLSARVERFIGLYQSIQRIAPADRLGSFSAIWAQPLHVKALR